MRVHQPEPRKIDVVQAGQVIVLFALMLVALIGLVGIAIDVTFAWRKSLEVQRAADAGSLAGVVYLPGDVTNADARALAETSRNGYSTATGAIVTANPDPSNDHQMVVTVQADVPTFFVRIFGVDSFTVKRTAVAAFVMPVPMGSPLNYYGVGCLVLKTGTAPACNSTGTGASGVSYGGSSLNSLGAWGAIITRGGNEENGDAYAPENDSTYRGPKGNTKYDASGYFYAISLPSGGDIAIFDPGFCAMGSNGAGGMYGVGDHWIAGSQNPVSTYYTLWNTNNVPLNKNGWTPMSQRSGTLFENQRGSDPANSGPTGLPACDAYHNKWWTLATGLGAGTYQVQVTTTNTSNASINAATNAENMFAIAAKGTGAQVYGSEKMAVYNNLVGGSQKFYLAKVDKVTGNGKVLNIDLFDPGDVSGDAVLKIWSPSGPGGAQMQVTNFSYTTDSNCVPSRSDACSASNRSQIKTASSGSSSFNNTWIHITIPLGTSYGNAGLWQGGWWQIEYVAGKANDTTTWGVGVRGNPVHLVPGQGG